MAKKKITDRWKDEPINATEVKPKKEKSTLSTKSRGGYSRAKSKVKIIKPNVSTRKNKLEYAVNGAKADEKAKFHSFKSVASPGGPNDKAFQKQYHEKMAKHHRKMGEHYEKLAGKHYSAEGKHKDTADLINE